MSSGAGTTTTTVGSVAAGTFEEYVRLRSDALVRIACLVTRDWEEARDAVQDALISVYPRWASLEEGGRDAYVRRAVTNACLSRLRKLRRVRPVGDPALLAQAPVTADPATAVGIADAAWRLCADLPPVQRAAVVLRFHDDLSFAEVAHALGCAEGTARSHIHRALKTLKARCEAGEGDE